MAGGREHLDVPARRVRGVGDGAVPGSVANGEELHVVPVEMYWVGERGCVMKVDADGGVIAKVEYVPLLDRQRSLANAKWREEDRW